MSKKDKKQQYVPPQPKYDKYEGCVAAFKMTDEAKYYADFSVFHSLKMKWIQNALGSVLVLILAIIALYRKETTAVIVFFVLTPIFPFLLTLIQYVSVKARLSSDKSFANTVHEYVFYDDFLNAVTKEGKKETTKFSSRYEDLHAVFERKDVYYVYFDPNSAFVLAKADLVSGDEEKLEELFSSRLGKRFKARRT